MENFIVKKLFAILYPCLKRPESFFGHPREVDGLEYRSEPPVP